MSWRSTSHALACSSTSPGNGKERMVEQSIGTSPCATTSVQLLRLLQQAASAPQADVCTSPSLGCPRITARIVDRPVSYGIDATISIAASRRMQMTMSR